MLGAWLSFWLLESLSPLPPPKKNDLQEQEVIDGDERSSGLRLGHLMDLRIIFIFLQK